MHGSNIASSDCDDSRYLLLLQQRRNISHDITCILLFLSLKERIQNRKTKATQ